MDQKFYIQIPTDNVWQSYKSIPEYDNLSDEELLATGWSKFFLNPSPKINLTKTVTPDWVVNGNTVTLNWIVADKTGEELRKAITNQWVTIRTYRQELLDKSDYTQMADAPFTNEQKATWATYRQALRDITNQSDPFNITWPTDPNNFTFSI